MEVSSEDTNKKPTLYRQNSATQPAGTSKITSASQPPSKASVSRSNSQESTAPLSSANSTIMSAAQSPLTKHISTASQPPERSESATPQKNVAVKSGDSLGLDKEPNAEMPDSKPKTVSEMISALRQNSVEPTRPQSDSIKAQKSPQSTASTNPTLLGRSSMIDAGSKHVDVILIEKQSKAPEGASEVPKASKVSELITSMGLSKPAESASSEMSTESITSKRASSSWTLPTTPSKIMSASQPPTNQPSASLRAPITEQRKDFQKQFHEKERQAPTTALEVIPNDSAQLPPPIPSRKVSPPTSQLLPYQVSSSAFPPSRRMPPVPPQSTPHSPIAGRPLPPTPPVAEGFPTPFLLRSTPLPAPPGMNASTAESTFPKTSTLPLKNPIAQHKTASLPPGIRLHVNADNETIPLQNDGIVYESHYDKIVYDKTELNVATRVKELEVKELKMKEELQKEQALILEEVKKISASVEHLRTWTNKCQEMLVEDTVKCQESVESLKARSNDVTRLLREHIIMISQDVSKAASQLFQHEFSAKEHRIMHIFDWSIKLIGSLDKSLGETVISHGYNIAELNYIFTAVAQYTRDGNIFLKITGARQSGTESTLSGNFDCRVCFTDASDTMPDWIIGRVMGNLFKDNEWVVGTISASELKEKNYCQDGHVFKIKFAIDLLK
ncbi:proteoglycan 4-like [Biomphalaria glabrata]|uniref:Proteoglycan 4-like n=1 Tax=Biomphalaria glabrata TaxID=6526 RepID=A0A9U8E8K2_BIOGL|nr:proteoglycan 4-like [Biomphalaria glabrata]XP_055898779.1 proteoglycan 4-like [Biomphalaria glabrata]